MVPHGTGTGTGGCCRNKSVPLLGTPLAVASLYTRFMAVMRTSASCLARLSQLRAPLARAQRGFKIYTRTGDRGSSSLFNGERRPKDDVIFQALGDTDELNAAIGLARARCDEAGLGASSDMLPQLDCIQSRLLDLGSAIATPRHSSSDDKVQHTAFDKGGVEVKSLEQWMDVMDAELPPLRNFILPSGGVASASLHVARAICRRAERSVVPLCSGGECDAGTAIYLNRLSDYLFVSARFASMRCDQPEVVYQKPRGEQ